MKENEEIYQIDVGYACFGLVFINNIVISAAPIAKWTIEKNKNKVLSYYKSKKRAKVIRYDWNNSSNDD